MSGNEAQPSSGGGSVWVAIVAGVVTIAAALIPWLISRNSDKEKRRRETREREAEKERADRERTPEDRERQRERTEARRRQREAADGWKPE